MLFSLSLPSSTSAAELPSTDGAKADNSGKATDGAAPTGVNVVDAWIACDDGEGNTYYYNSITEECQWEKPAGTDGDEHRPKTADGANEETKKLIKDAFNGKLKKFGFDAKALEKMNQAKVEHKAALAQLQSHLDDGGEHWVCH